MRSLISLAGTHAASRRTGVDSVAESARFAREFLFAKGWHGRRHVVQRSVGSFSFDWIAHYGLPWVVGAM